MNTNTFGFSISRRFEEINFKESSLVDFLNGWNTMKHMLGEDVNERVQEIAKNIFKKSEEDGKKTAADSLDCPFYSLGYVVYCVNPNLFLLRNELAEFLSNSTEKQRNILKADLEGILHNSDDEERDMQNIALFLKSVVELSGVLEKAKSIRVVTSVNSFVNLDRLQDLLGYFGCFSKAFASITKKWDQGGLGDRAQLIKKLEIYEVIESDEKEGWSEVDVEKDKEKVQKGYHLNEIFNRDNWEERESRNAALITKQRAIVEHNKDDDLRDVAAHCISYKVFDQALRFFVLMSKEKCCSEIGECLLSLAEKNLQEDVKSFILKMLELEIIDSGYTKLISEYLSKKIKDLNKKDSNRLERIPAFRNLLQTYSSILKEKRPKEAALKEKRPEEAASLSSTDEITDKANSSCCVIS